MSLTEKLNNLDKFRFYVADSNGRALSDVWFMQGEGQGFYIAPSKLGSALKLSFHPPNIASDGCDCQFGHPRHYAERAAAEGYLPMKPIRWKRAVTPKTGAIHVASILFPSDHLKSASRPPPNRKLKFQLPQAPPGMATEIGLFLSQEAPATLEQKFINLGGTPIGYSDFPNDEFMSMVVRHADHNQFFNGNFPENGSPRLLSGAPKPGENTAARAIIASATPVNGQPFYLAEVGPMTVTGVVKGAESMSMVSD